MTDSEKSATQQKNKANSLPLHIQTITRYGKKRTATYQEAI